MTRKDYVAIAAAFKNADKRDDGETIAASVMENIADAMARDNPRFDRARFLKACGVQP